MDGQTKQECMLTQAYAQMLQDELSGTATQALSAQVSVPQAMRTLKGCFEDLFRCLCREEERVFSNTYSRIVFIIDRENIGKGIQRDIHRLRSILEQGSRQEQADAPDQETSQANLQTALSLFKGIAGYFCGTDMPDEKDTQTQEPLPYDSNPKKTYDLKAVLTHITDWEQDSHGRYYTIEVLPHEIDRQNSSQGEVIPLRIYQSYGKSERADLASLKRLLWDYCTLHILGAAHTTENGVPFFYTRGDTILVIEPDYLLDVTDIAECSQGRTTNPMLFFLSKIVGDKDSEALLKGKLINDLLDAMIKQPGVSHRRIFRETLSGNLLKAAKYGGQKIEEMWRSVLCEHVPNLEAFARSLGEKQVYTEPTFISSRYGLQGRLDVLVEDPLDPSRKDIIELKSSKAPSGAALWSNNQTQVTCYNMLLDSAYGTSRTGNSALLYSGAKESPLRNTLSTVNEYIAVADTRNKILWGIYCLAQGDMRILGAITPSKFGAAPSFKQEKIEEFARAYAGFSPLEKNYYHAFLAFTLREMLTAKTGAGADPSREGGRSKGFSALWRATRAEKQEDFNIIHSMHLQKFNAKDSSAVFSLSIPMDHTFRQRDVAVVYPLREGAPDDALRGQILKGYIRQISPQKITFVFRNNCLDSRLLSVGTSWSIEHDLFESNYWASAKSLWSFLTGNEQVKKLVLLQQEPQSGLFPHRNDPSLTANQNQTIAKALAAQDYFILQGPPGTGKTSAALMHIVKGILGETNQTICIAAYTNRAVAEITAKLRLNSIDFLRLGHTDGADDASDETITGFSTGKSIDDIRSFIASKRVIVSTVAAFTSRLEDLKEIIRTDVLLIDEASQLSEPQLAGLLSPFRKFILIGDQKQLPAVVAQSPHLCHSKDEELIQAGLTSLKNSLFERLYTFCEQRGLTHAYGMLDTQFRMHEQIADLINPWYGHRLKTGTERQSEPFSPSNTDASPLNAGRFVFVPSDYLPTPKTHRQEAQRVASLLTQIKAQLGDNFSESSVGVVTPWRAQIGAIRSLVTDPDILEKVTIDTVERFQGGEKDIIIASLAVFSPAQLSSLESPDTAGTLDRKLNVTLSRARNQFILLAHEPVLQQSAFYRPLLEKATYFPLQEY